MIKWTKAFETGTSALDEQHRLLIENINVLGELASNPTPTAAEVSNLVAMVSYLSDYSEIHFRSEEHCMLKSQCPAYAENLKAHEYFRSFIRDFQTQCDVEHFNLELVRNLHELMESWVQEHILKIDIQLNPELRLNQLSTQPNETGNRLQL
jgi:hemerythrin